MYTIASFSGASLSPVTRPLTVRNCGPFCLSGGGGPVLPPLGPGVYCAAASPASNNTPHVIAKIRFMGLIISGIQVRCRKAAARKLLQMKGHILPLIIVHVHLHLASMLSGDHVIRLASRHALREFAGMVAGQLPLGFLLVGAADLDLDAVCRTVVRAVDGAKDQRIRFFCGRIGG